jgi:hypothetical protein
LPFPSIFPLDLGQSKQYTRHHPADWSTEINLLGHHDDADISSTPVRQEIDATLLPSCQSIQLPHDDRCDGPGGNCALQPGKGRPVQRLSPFALFRPLHCGTVEALVMEPASEFNFLTVRFLRAGRHPTITGDHDAFS